MNKYDISVIIPIYNKENFLKRSVGSVIDQTFGFERIELILVDNKSTDSSRDIMDEYNQLYENVKCIYLDKNSGTPCTPRNTGIEKASGEYLMFLDADDTYDNQICEKLYNKIIESGKNIVGCRFNAVKLGQNLPKEQLFESSEIELNPLNNLVLLEKGMDWWMCWDKIYNKDFIMEHNIRFPPDIMAEDVIFVIQSFLLDENMIFLNDYYGYNWNILDEKDNASLSHSYDRKTLLGFIEGFYFILELTKNCSVEVLEILFRQFLITLFSIFCLLDESDVKSKKELLLKIYELEKSLNINIKFPFKWNLFNILLLNKQFWLLIPSAKLMGFLWFNFIKE